MEEKRSSKGVSPGGKRTESVRKMLTLIPNQESVSKAASYVEETVEKAGIGRKDSYKISIALDELYSNIVFYSGASEAKISCQVDEHWITLCLQDNGIPFDPLQREEADMKQLADEEQIGGRGIFLVKKLMSEVAYEYKDGYNEVTVKLQRS